MISYREGQPAEAIGWTTRVSNLRSQSVTLALIVRAIAEHRLGQIELARETLRAAELQIPVALRTLGAGKDSTPLPAMIGITDHAWLVPEILRREAAEILK